MFRLKRLQVFLFFVQKIKCFVQIFGQALRLCFLLIRLIQK